MAVEEHSDVKAHGKLFDDYHRIMFTWLAALIFFQMGASGLIIFDQIPRKLFYFLILFFFWGSEEEREREKKRKREK